jgi:hypothetical protein
MHVLCTIYACAVRYICMRCALYTIYHTGICMHVCASILSKMTSAHTHTHTHTHTHMYPYICMQTSKPYHIHTYIHTRTLRGVLSGTIVLSIGSHVLWARASCMYMLLAVGL